uniref:F-box domain-containing protein n=1 Tax=Aegilops tauschii TaxID=37682 RepID=N1QTE5_AEGTA
MGNNLTGPPGRTLADARTEGVATVLITCRCNPSLICHHNPPRDNPSAGRRGGHREPTRSGPAGAAAFGDLPAELLATIASKLDAKQAARTSVLSTTWRHAWKHSPRLALDMPMPPACRGAGHGSDDDDPREKQYRAFLDERRRERFVYAVDLILRQRRGGAVEQLELRIDVEYLGRLSRRLDDWLHRAVSPRTKSVTLDVSRRPDQGYGQYRYEFPLQSLVGGGGGVSGLQHLHLSCVSLKAPPSSRRMGFPKLQRLGLRSSVVSAGDLRDVLSNCPNLEWLDLYRVQLNDELKVDTPLPRLRYLTVSNCGVTKIQLNANRLTTFIFQGHPLATINLRQSSGLHDVNIHCCQITLKQALSSLPAAFPMAQRLSLCCTCMLPEFPWQMDKTSIFSRLRHLQLILNIGHKHVDDILSIALFLRAALLLEHLDIFFVSCCMDGGQGPLRNLPQGQLEYKCLKTLRVRQFRGKKSQVELLVHIVKNAPALEILTIDTRRQLIPANFCQATEAEKEDLSKIRRMATTFIGGKLSPKTKEAITDENLAKQKEISLEIEKLLEQEEIYWAQRGRIDWLLFGDKNTNYFQKFATERRKRNMIKRLKDDKVYGMTT